MKLMDCIIRRGKIHGLFSWEKPLSYLALVSTFEMQYLFAIVYYIYDSDIEKASMAGEMDGGKLPPDNNSF